MLKAVEGYWGFSSETPLAVIPKQGPRPSDIGPLVLAL